MTRRLTAAAAVFAACLAIIVVDLVLRGRAAYLEGERYMSWHENPALQRDYYQRRFEVECRDYERLRAAGSLSEDELRERIALAQSLRDGRSVESPLKYAVQAFRGAALFEPPATRWTRLARERAAVALSLWKAELDARHIPYQPYQLE